MLEYKVDVLYNEVRKASGIAYILLELIQKSDIFTDDVVRALLHDCGAIRRMLIASINTTKSNIIK